MTFEALIRAALSRLVTANAGVPHPGGGVAFAASVPKMAATKTPRISMKQQKADSLLKQQKDATDAATKAESEKQARIAAAVTASNTPLAQQARRGYANFWKQADAAAKAGHPWGPENTPKTQEEYGKYDEQSYDRLGNFTKL